MKMKMNHFPKMKCNFFSKISLNQSRYYNSKPKEVKKKDSILSSIEMYLDRNPGLTEESILFKIQQKLEDKTMQIPFKVAKLRASKNKIKKKKN